MEKQDFKNSGLRQHIKIFSYQMQKSFQRFSNNLVVKSLVSGFLSSLPVIMVASLFILIYSIPEAIDSNLDNIESFNYFKSFCTRSYNLSFGIVGVIVTGNIARALMDSLNLRLPYNKKVGSYNLLVVGMIVYLILAAVPLYSSDFTLTTKQIIANGYSFDAVYLASLGAQGMLPGIVVGLTCPWIYYWCYKYNITIRLPKSVPQAISQTFLTIIPFFFVMVIWSLISFGFVAGLGQPFIPWLFDKLDGLFPAKLTSDQFNNMTESEQIATIKEQLNSFGNSYAICCIYRFLETFSWFIGVHPQAINTTFQTVQLANQAMNEKIHELGYNYSFAFVVSTSYSIATMGGTGSTFVVPVICLLFCRSNQLKVTGKTAIVPTFFQVNEPCLFGCPIVLNPIYFIPFVSVPIINECLSKFFVDNLGLIGARIYVPWTVPWFISGVIAENGQPIEFLQLFCGFVIAFVIYLPFVLFQDKQYVAQEKAKALAENRNYFAISGIQYQLNKTFYFDNKATKEYRIAAKELGKNRKNLSLAEYKNEILRLKNNKMMNTISNLTIIFDEIKSQKTEKVVSKFQDAVTLIKNKLDNLDIKKDKHNEKINQKIARYQDFEENTGKSYQAKINSAKSKIQNEAKVYNLKIDHLGIQKLNLEKLNLKNNIKILKIKKSKTKDSSEKQKFNLEISKLKKDFKNFVSQYKASVKQINLSKANNFLKNHKNPYDKENLENTKKEKIINTTTKPNDQNKSYKILVVCIGAGTSAMLANAINDGVKKESDLKLVANALASDTYQNGLNGADLVILSPQMRAYFESVKKEAAEYGVKVVQTSGKQYIDLTNNPTAALEFVKTSLNLQDENKQIKSEDSISQKTPNGLDQNKSYKILVVCIGAGTSAMLANAINDGVKKESDLKLVANALASDTYQNGLNGADLVILSPQMRAYFESVKKEAAEYGVKVVQTSGKQYIDLTNNPTAALEFVKTSLK